MTHSSPQSCTSATRHVRACFWLPLPSRLRAGVLPLPCTGWSTGGSPEIGRNFGHKRPKHPSNCQGMSRGTAPVSESSVPPPAFDVSGGTIPVPRRLFVHGLFPVGDGGRGLGSQSGGFLDPQRAGQLPGVRCCAPSAGCRCRRPGHRINLRGNRRAARRRQSSSGRVASLPRREPSSSPH
jgi:hypothetical protein